MKRILFILILFCSVQGFGQLVNQYNFNEGSGTTLTDRCGTANGTLGGSTLPTWSSNKYLKFSGGHGATAGNWGRVDLPKTTFNYTYSSSFSIVIGFRSSKSDANIHFLFSNTNYSSVNGSIMIDLEADETQYQLVYDTGAKYHDASSVNLCDGKWHLTTMTYSNNTFKVYIDGKLITNSTDQTCTGNFYSTSSKVSLGAAWINNGSTYWRDFTGDIFRLKNYANALTPAQVKNENLIVRGFF